MIEVYQSVAEQNTITNIQEEDENSDSDLLAVQKENKVFSQSEPSHKLVSKKSDNKFITRNNQDDELVTKYDYSKIDTKRDDKKIDELSAKYDYSRVAIKRPTNLEKQYNITTNNLAKKELDKKATAEPYATRRDDKKQSTIDKRRLSQGGPGNILGLDKSKILARTNTSENINEVSKVTPQRNLERKASVLLIPSKRDSMGLSANMNKSFTGKPEDRKRSTLERANSIILSLYI